MKNYLLKMRGQGASPPRPPLAEIARGWLGAFVGLAALGFIHERLSASLEVALLFGPFGASAVLVFAAPKSPLAQPRNLLCGHLLSALTGIAVCNLLPEPVWLAGALAVSTSIALMHLTGSLHPPGGATALVAALTGAGPGYAIFPVAAGAVTLLALAVALNNAMPGRSYPEYWW